MPNEMFRRYARGDKESASQKNAELDELERLSRMASGGNGPPTGSNSSGVFGSGMLDRSLRITNAASSDVPAFGIMRITGVPSSIGYNRWLTVGQPNTYGSQYMHLVNGPQEITVGDGGRFVPEPFPCYALYDSADGTPAAGELWGPRSGSWKLKKNTGGFMIVGNPFSYLGQDIVLVERVPFLRFKGRTDAAIALGASGTISIYSGTNEGTDTTVDMASVYNDFADVAISKDVECVWQGDLAGTAWKLVAAEC